MAVETAGQQAAARVAIVLALALAAVVHQLNQPLALLLALRTLLLLVQVVRAAAQMQTAVKDQIQFLAPLPRPAAVMAVVITGQQEQMVAQVGQAVAAVA